MDKIFSARVDESVIQKIVLLAHRLKTSKKAVVEAAIRAYEENVQADLKVDLLDATFGVWTSEAPLETPREDPRKVFNDSMQRHQR